MVCFTCFELNSQFSVPFIIDSLRLNAEKEKECEKIICNVKPLKRFRICGTDEKDKKTYPNECLFKKAQCKNGKLRKLYNGPCKGKYNIM